MKSVASKLQVGVVGLGVVGMAVYNGFSPHMEVIGYDKYKSDIPEEVGLRKLEGCSVIFVCVPSPTTDGEQRLAELHKVLEVLDEREYEGVVAVKCTLLPGTMRMMSQGYKYLKLVHNPEFLNARTADDDFRKQEACLLGGDHEHCAIVRKVYREMNNQIDFFLERYEHTEMAKYMCNVFGAVKVSLMNEIEQACKNVGAEYKSVRLLAVNSVPWLDREHTLVPGPDGEHGFGGMCLPKDIEAFSSFLTDNHSLNNVVRSAIATNAVVRSSKHVVREKDGNAKETTEGFKATSKEVS